MLSDSIFLFPNGQMSVLNFRRDKRVNPEIGEEGKFPERNRMHNGCLAQDIYHGPSDQITSCLKQNECENNETMPYEITCNSHWHISLHNHFERN